MVKSRFDMKALGIFLILMLAAPAFADGQTTGTSAPPSTGQAIAPTAMAPAYLAVGKELRLRVALIRRTIDELGLDESVRTQAHQIIDSTDDQLRRLMADVAAGKMPAYETIMAVPQEMRAAHEKLLALIGPEKTQLLEEKLRSLRGEARARLGKLRQDIDDLTLAGKIRGLCDGIISQADAAVEKLPDTDEEGDAYEAGRQEMEQLFAHARVALAKVLSPIEVSRLYPSTQPSPQS
jgi:hypothetical protein